MPLSYGDNLIYRDWDPVYRSPAGALPAGTPLRFFVACPAPEITACALLWQEGDGEPKHIPMKRVSEGFTLHFPAIQQPLVGFYRFQAETPAGPLYLGRAPESFWAAPALTPDAFPPFQLTVHTADFETPAWFRGGILYQIFPDRFAPGDPKTVAAGLNYHRAMGRKMQLHPQWDAPVKWKEDDGTAYNPNDFYGGTLEAITRRLPYLHDLGISALYLNPIFEADSNHRYNTADYRRIDPILGTAEDLEILCRQAGELGIRVILDGVFSHTGADSRYFNQKGNYPEAGACQSRDSLWYSWYTFSHWPTEYRAWWGFPSLPEVREEDPGWRDEIITGPDSVIRHWLRAGVSGYRLDVADELPDTTLADIRKAVKSVRPDALILGEVWEDPTTKVSYGQRRRYALGESLDSTMNYPLRRGILDFLLWKSDSRALLRLLLGQRLHYPLPLYQSLMNLLSSHDVDRALTVLSSRLEGDGLTREQRAGFLISEAQRARGKAAMELATALIWSLPGVPSIYYGEEAGMQGFGDPFVRQSMDWESVFLQEHYCRLGNIRKKYTALQTGTVAFSAPSPHCLCIVRQCPDSGETLLTVAARADTEAVLDLEDLVGDEISCTGFSRAVPLWGETQLALRDGLLPISLPAGGWEIYSLDAMPFTGDIPE